MLEGAKTAPVVEKTALRQAERLKTAPTSVQVLFKRIYARKASPRTCIKAFCLECLGFDRQAISECTAWACPLHHLRPFQNR